MINQPQFDSYSTAARVCLGVAVFSATMLAALMTSILM
ncbi:hypothetical protein ACVMIH_001352 [Bradyrhizobium sp. USDA 4503]|uniref:Uncharacterized protein n=1 Tax=Bradyrhizobium brasilense TaxID=1419277 RepID=A0A1G7AHE2_9BRAD|nr:hypothetical protein [Bradyrhizobium sp. USDA 4541]MCP1915966.1 hypothetical protein [Bradyrhizobium elkanii]SDE13877.1 hypothetical protein SAMN05216337_1020115 [Bradyrhizobium brasilense]